MVDTTPHETRPARGAAVRLTITEAQRTNRCLVCGATATWVSRGEPGGIAVPYCAAHGREEEDDG